MGQASHRRREPGLPLFVAGSDNKGPIGDEEREPFAEGGSRKFRPGWFGNLYGRAAGRTHGCYIPHEIASGAWGRR
ncbi:MAG: hypothetical protein Ct9H300mP11_33400 [Chloroflexota bacterium]|nr:MAG: hypothetical protein Ct9H300mP11_33400 [Chloroflexota bacterium]